MKKVLLVITASALLFTSSFILTPVYADSYQDKVDGIIGNIKEEKPDPVYKLYNAVTNETYYTRSKNKKLELCSKGWIYKGVAWYSPKVGTPVYRVYSKTLKDSYFTSSKKEKDSLVKKGWTYKGIEWFSSSKNNMPVYHAYNSKLKTGSHNYTLNKKDHENLIKKGWVNKPIQWYAIKPKATLNEKVYNTEKVKKLIIELVNKERKKVGASSLKQARTGIQKTADLRNMENVQLKDISHTRPNGKDFWTAAVQMGIPRKNWDISENLVARSYTTESEEDIAKALVKAWKSSPSHYGAIKDPVYEEVGTAVCFDYSRNWVYSTQIFFKKF